MTGTRNHWLPAALIARFTSNPDLATPARERPVWWWRREIPNPMQSSAESRAWKRDLYETAESPGLWEKVWQQFEGPLVPALELLEQQSEKVESRFLIDSRNWLEVLVPYATAQLVRGRDFPVRMRRRLCALFGNADDRLVQAHPQQMALELQRMLAPVVAARWVCVVASPDAEFILSDRGWSPWDCPRHGLGILFPTSPRHALFLVPTDDRAVLMRCTKEGSMADFFVCRLNTDETMRANNFIAQSAFAEIYASKSELLESHASAVPHKPCLIELGQIGFVTGPALIPSEFDWHRLVAFALNPHEPPEIVVENIVDGIINSRFIPPLIFPVNIPTLTTTAIYGGLFTDWGCVLGLKLFNEAFDLHNREHKSIYDWPENAQRYWVLVTES